MFAQLPAPLVEPITEITTNQNEGLSSQRWFGVALTVSLMLLGSGLFASGLPPQSWSLRLQAVSSIMSGPFSLTGDQIFTRHSPGWMIWIAITVCLLPLHMLRPSVVTLFGTLVGGFFWWFTGVLVLGAGC